jgi:hypothetical protein
LRIAPGNRSHPATARCKSASSEAILSYPVWPVCSARAARHSGQITQPQGRMPVLSKLAVGSSPTVEVVPFKLTIQGAFLANRSARVLPCKSVPATRSKRGLPYATQRHAAQSLQERRGLLKHRLRCLFLFVRQVAVLAEDAFHQRPQFRADAFFHRPVDRHIAPNRLDQFAGNRS